MSFQYHGRYPGASTCLNLALDRAQRLSDAHCQICRQREPYVGAKHERGSLQRRHYGKPAPGVDLTPAENFRHANTLRSARRTASLLDQTGDRLRLQGLTLAFTAGETWRFCALAPATNLSVRSSISWLCGRTCRRQQ